MLLTQTTTHRPATDLGYLLHKRPDRFQSFAQSFGTAHVFYPEASEERCAAALLLEIDPVGLSRGKGDTRAPLAPYVNDRPYVAVMRMRERVDSLMRYTQAYRAYGWPTSSSPMPSMVVPLGQHHRARSP